jgi:hypothetical protein
MSRICGALAVHDGPVAFLEIGDAVGEGGEGDGVEPTNISPSPWPMARGEPLRAAIRRSSSPSKRKRRA